MKFAGGRSVSKTDGKEKEERKKGGGERERGISEIREERKYVTKEE